MKKQEQEEFLAKLKTQKWRAIQGEISRQFRSFPGAAGVRAKKRREAWEGYLQVHSGYVQALSKRIVTLEGTERFNAVTAELKAGADPYLMEAACGDNFPSLLLWRMVEVVEGRLIEELLFPSPAAEILGTLRIDDQRKLYSDTVAVWTTRGKATTKPFADLSKIEAVRVFDTTGRRVRNLEEQRELAEVQREHRAPITEDTIMWFGMHRGRPVKDVPDDYLDWLRRQPDVSKRWKTFFGLVECAVCRVWVKKERYEDHFQRCHES
jgi:hypothetical protein